MITIYCTIKSSKENVVSVLDDLHRIIRSESFSLDDDLYFNIKDKTDDIKHSTTYTLSDLEYDARDVVDRLDELKLEEYSESLFDKDNTDPPLLFVFGKIIDGKQVYIKFKIRNNEHTRIICISFHYASKEMAFPYAK